MEGPSYDDAVENRIRTAVDSLIQSKTADSPRLRATKDRDGLISAVEIATTQPFHAVANSVAENLVDPDRSIRMVTAAALSQRNLLSLAVEWPDFAPLTWDLEHLDAFIARLRDDLTPRARQAIAAGTGWYLLLFDQSSTGSVQQRIESVDDPSFLSHLYLTWKDNLRPPIIESLKDRILSTADRFWGGEALWLAVHGPAWIQGPASSTVADSLASMIEEPLRVSSGFVGEMHGDTWPVVGQPDRPDVLLWIDRFAAIDSWVLLQDSFMEELTRSQLRQMSASLPAVIARTSDKALLTALNSSSTPPEVAMALSDHSSDRVVTAAWERLQSQQPLDSSRLPRQEDIRGASRA